MNSFIFWLRILLSPFIFLYGIFLLIAYTMFGLPIPVIYSLFALLSTPTFFSLRKSGVIINYPTPFISHFNNTMSENHILLSNIGNHFITTTIYLWGAFFVTYHYIKTAKIIKIEI